MKSVGKILGLVVILEVIFEVLFLTLASNTLKFSFPLLSFSREAKIFFCSLIFLYLQNIDYYSV